MIEPTYATFEQAKWLKEKGFDNVCSNYYHIRGKLMNLENGDTGEWECDSPEQWQVVEWLRVEKGIWVSVLSTPDLSMFYFAITTKRSKNRISENYNSPQEAYSVAFDYIKDNDLI
jgi:hypothetical protein